MELLILILCLSSPFVIGTTLPGVDNMQPQTIDIGSNNLTNDSNKEMYVIHAMVYQVGIITNKTEDDANNTEMIGNQEAVTFYHTNGSKIDLSQIPQPLVTNVTAQRLVGVAPATPAADNPNAGAVVSWAQLKKLASEQNDPEHPANQRFLRAASEINNEERNLKQSLDENMPYLERLYKRSLEHKHSESDKSPVKIVSGGAVIPQEAGVHSIAIPPLLTFNNNFSEIPVPIPNTSVVHYAKVNTLIHQTP